MARNEPEECLRVLITVKTYPIPSDTYDELVCTAGVTESGEFVRLYPINFRDLPNVRKYQKYQWISVQVVKHGRKDLRKESYRPVPGSIKTLGEQIKANPGNWKERATYVLMNKSQSIEDLWDRQTIDRTSLGVFKPKSIQDLVISPDDPDWNPKFLYKLQQARLWEDRKASLKPLRKVPFQFHYRFKCNDERCNGHSMSIHDWEVGALFWNCVRQGDSHEIAAQKVKNRFLNEICSPENDTHFLSVLSISTPEAGLC